MITAEEVNYQFGNVEGKGVKVIVRFHQTSNHCLEQVELSNGLSLRLIYNEIVTGSGSQVTLKRAILARSRTNNNADYPVFKDLTDRLTFSAPFDNSKDNYLDKLNQEKESNINTLPRGSLIISPEDLYILDALQNIEFSESNLATNIIDILISAGIFGGVYSLLPIDFPVILKAGAGMILPAIYGLAQFCETSGRDLSIGNFITRKAEEFRNTRKLRNYSKLASQIQRAYQDLNEAKNNNRQFRKIREKLERLTQTLSASFDPFFEGFQHEFMFQTKEEALKYLEELFTTKKRQTINQPGKVDFIDPWCELKEPETKAINPWVKLESVVQNV
ncbi:hypothetical protein HZA97_04655 [Candidatus Woesearchaeota archaeon]|nr:hypothetical protein [Candidatus Woesearchaeota archaeon]